MAQSAIDGVFETDGTCEENGEDGDELDDDELQRLAEEAMGFGF